MNWNTISFADYNSFGWSDWDLLFWQDAPTPVGPGTVKTTLSLGLGLGI